MLIDPRHLVYIIQRLPDPNGFEFDHKEIRNVLEYTNWTDPVTETSPFIQLIFYIKGYRIKKDGEILTFKYWVLDITKSQE